MKGKRQPVRLAGGFVCELTVAEQNAWTQYVRFSPAWRDFAVEKARQKGLMARQGATGVDLDEPIRRGEARCQRTIGTLLLLAKAWYADLLIIRSSTPQDPAGWAYDEQPPQAAQGEGEPVADGSPARDGTDAQDAPAGTE